jgi:phosphoglycolate phosphatase-like HAD superfamily hydrolase
VLHREALHEALREIYGIADATAHRVAAAGRTDTAIAREIAALSGAERDGDFDARLAEFAAACCAAFERLCPPSTPDLVTPGIAELLGLLSKREDVVLSLLTGNYEPIARLKLDRAGIGHYFAPGQGAFGSDAESRADLGPVARARAGVPGSPYPRERTIVIGDTPRDVACAHADGLRAIAIATGPYAAAELHEADAVAANAGELHMLLEQALA